MEFWSMYPYRTGWLFKRRWIFFPNKGSASMKSQSTRTGDVLKMLEDKYAMGIVTGRPRIEARYALKRFNMESFFPVLITMDDIPDGKFKPHPFGIELAMAKLPGLKTYYIGDTVDDMIAAKEANAIPIGVINRAGRKNTLKKLLMDHGAVFVLDDINKILEVLS
jgi:phosphoglycolate phosphatase-like HAD superfamily hydrolase